MLKFSSDALVRVSAALLQEAGASGEEAQVVAEFLVQANLCGVDSHGVLRLMEYVDAIERGQVKPGAKIEKVKETRSTALVDGNWGFGQVICKKGMDIAIEKARKSMVSSVGIFHSYHVGRLADYALMATKQDMIAFLVANADPSVAPYGGRKGVIGTNPLAFAVPSGDMPVVVDFATSTVAEGKVRAALFKGERVPEGWIVDRFGRDTTNPADLYEPPLPPAQIRLAGALLPFGQWKGYGLGLIVDILGGALTGGGCDGDVPFNSNGALFQVISIESFVPLKEFKMRVERVIRQVKNSPTAPGVTEILIPGEPEFKLEERRRREGIPIPEKTWNDICAVCNKYGIDAENMATSR